MLKETQGQPTNRSAIAVFLGETAPENLTGQIKEFQPTFLIVLDAVDTGAEPGCVHLIEPDEIAPGAGMSTHSASLNLLLDYLAHFLICDIVIIGIQPQTLEFAAPPSESVLKAAKSVASAIAFAR